MYHLKLTSFIYIFISIFSSHLLSGQSFTSLMEISTKKVANAKKIEMLLTIEQIDKSNQQKVVQKISMYKNLEQLHYIYGNYEYIYDGKSSVWIDKVNKIIYYDEKAASKHQKQAQQLPITLPDSLLNTLKKFDVSSIIKPNRNDLLGFNVKHENQNIVIFFLKEQQVIYSFEYTYKYANKDYLFITTYETLNLNPSFSSPLFTINSIVKKVGQKYVGVGKYLNFKIILQ